MPNIDYTQRTHVYLYLYGYWAKHKRGPSIRTIARGTGVTVNVAKILHEFETAGVVLRMDDGKRIPASDRLTARISGE